MDTHQQDTSGGFAAGDTQRIGQRVHARRYEICCFFACQASASAAELLSSARQVGTFGTRAHIGLDQVDV
jgi:hypothetical protein